MQRSVIHYVTGFPLNDFPPQRFEEFEQNFQVLSSEIIRTHHETPITYQYRYGHYERQRVLIYIDGKYRGEIITEIHRWGPPQGGNVKTPEGIVTIRIDEWVHTYEWEDDRTLSIRWKDDQTIRERFLKEQNLCGEESGDRIYHWNYIQKPDWDRLLGKGAQKVLEELKEDTQ